MSDHAVGGCSPAGPGSRAAGRALQAGRASCIRNISFASRQVSCLSGKHQLNVQPSGFEQKIELAPVIAGGLHHDQAHVLVQQVFGQPIDLVRHGPLVVIPWRVLPPSLVMRTQQQYQPSSLPEQDSQHAKGGWLENFPVPRRDERSRPCTADMQFSSGVQGVAVHFVLLGDGRRGGCSLR